MRRQRRLVSRFFLRSSGVTLDSTPLAGHIDFGYPEDGVEDDLAEVVVAPVLMVVAAGEAEAAAAIGPAAAPGDDLSVPPLDRFADCGVALVGAIGPVHRALGRHGGQDRPHRLGVVPETDVEIPFIGDLKRLYAAQDGARGQVLEIGLPGRIDRPVGLKATAGPFDEFLFAAFLCGLDRIMNAAPGQRPGPSDCRWS